MKVKAATAVRRLKEMVGGTVTDDPDPLLFVQSIQDKAGNVDLWQCFYEFYQWTHNFEPATAKAASGSSPRCGPVGSGEDE